MKKNLLSLLCALFISVGAFAASNHEPQNSKKPVSIQTLMQTMTVEDFVKLTPKEFRKKTGQKLSLKEAFAMKMMQKKLKKELNKSANPKGGEKKQLVALLLILLLGGLSIHRFYLGYVWQGIVQIITLGGCGIWLLIDLIRIIMNTLKTKDGQEMTPW